MQTDTHIQVERYQHKIHLYTDNINLLNHLPFKVFQPKSVKQRTKFWGEVAVSSQERLSLPPFSCLIVNYILHMVYKPVLSPVSLASCFNESGFLFHTHEYTLPPLHCGWTDCQNRFLQGI